MPQDFAEGGLTFSFPDSWLICRPQDSSYYRSQFQKFCGGCKEMDFLAYDPGTRIFWLIEVKDYRVNPRKNPVSLADEVAQKTRDVCALLPTAKLRDQNLSSPGHLQVGEFWRRASGARQFRVLLHCELPINSSKLFPEEKDASNLQTALRQKLKCVDPRSRFTNRHFLHQWPWTVK